MPVVGFIKGFQQIKDKRKRAAEKNKLQRGFFYLTGIAKADDIEQNCYSKQDPLCIIFKAARCVKRDKYSGYGCEKKRGSSRAADSES